MAFGILEPKTAHKEDHVPGTIKLLDSANSNVVALNPRPSDSPDDPLRWPSWKKHTVLVILALGCMLSGIQGTCLAVATVPIIEEVGLTLEQTESLTSYSFLAIAFGCATCAILARLVGKRPVYLISTIFGLAGAIWNATGTSYGSLVGSRVLYGYGAGALESLPLASIGDIYFVHERGRSTAFFSFLCLGIVQIAPILGGYLTETYGWRTQFWALTGAWILLLILTFFLSPETTFNRESRFETDLATLSADESVEESDNGRDVSTDKGEAMVETSQVDSMSNLRRRTYAQELKLYRKIEGRVSVGAATWLYVATGLYPIVWFTFLILGSFLAWYIGINVTLAQIFAAPPIEFGPTELGYLNTFGVVGAILAEVLLHSLSDRSCEWLAKRNNSVHEPEFRLLMLVAPLLMTVLAYPLFGWYAGVVALEREISWVAASVLFGLVVFTLVSAQSVAFAYLLDAHREISIEAGMFAIMLRSVWTYGASTFVPDWLVYSGVANAFYEITGLQAGLTILSGVIMYVYGKRVRYFMSQHSPITTLRQKREAM